MPALESDRTDLENVLADLQTDAMLRPVLGGLAHHFNNLLSGVLGLVTLAPTLPAESLASLADKVKDQVERASHLTRLVLSITRCSHDAGAASATDLSVYTRDAVAVARTIAPAHVNIDLEGDLEPVWGVVSASAYANLLLHLLVAAIDLARPRPAPTVRLSLGKDGDACVVTLTAEALAVPRCDHERLAELLTREPRDPAALRLVAASRIAAREGMTLSTTRNGLPAWCLRIKAMPG
ncbi:MAG: hypothetical protein HY903_02240 [Deltaproteobacteria bacterium]|nr:hypothetical protein [Deltaproteobacteria bacterium]